MDARGVLPIRTVNRDGSAPTTYRKRDPEAVRGGTVHYTAGPASATVVGVAAYQTGPYTAPSQPDFPAIAYHYFVERSGTVYWCHDLDVRVWHSDGYQRNETYVGVCYAGDYEPSREQRRGLATAFRHAELQMGHELVGLEGHRDASETSCPGPTLRQWLPQVLDRLKALR